MDLTLSKKTKVKQSKRSGEGVTAYVTEHTPTPPGIQDVKQSEWKEVHISRCVESVFPGKVF